MIAMSCHYDLTYHMSDVLQAGMTPSQVAASRDIKEMLRAHAK